ncbi:linalool dehydratase-isomerase precursor [Fusarium albosuccineum]|uniref:Linalool dehydratase-isomerase n=1 Tax=Fusarium albosuccineum TaxID=1237068 RepID=A0A8H4L699_9HYPO|nr:linalool dehydratase-isomerase precursor [Fusarium albosuccineum]
MSTVTTTRTSSRLPLLGSESAADEHGCPTKLGDGFLDAFPKLSREQAGHLRHFHNLSSQRDGEWQHMGTQDAGQEWLDAYRYQLAIMTYAAATAHYNRLPVLRSAFRNLMLNLIHKMLLRDVWGYWFLTSHSGVFVDPDIKELRKPWADPIVKENIMNPLFWGMGPEKFSYTRQSLQAAILREMEREKWLGVCCEPNNIFIVCNQFPLVALRYNDIRDKTNISEEVLEKYQAAWKAKGMRQENGLFISWYYPKQDKKKPSRDIGGTAWSAAYMNAWNPSVGHGTWKQAIGFLAKPNDQAIVSSKQWPKEFRLPVKTPVFGYVMQWVSEVGDQATLAGLLAHVDGAFNPTWLRGGLFYRPQESEKSRLSPTVDAFTGNAAIGYSRLNVFDGQRNMYEDPWGEEHFANTPHIEGIDFSSDVDFLRAAWNEELNALAITMRTWNNDTKQLVQPLGTIT